ncbi:NAD(P)-binding protein [Polychaeton citri CBS 116435]|uniref:NAD(P)-binding protein n=1 Tax=Polychaeton citri CBS 116435 TaxID=1314669 RepID=A0A9P4UT92_9PEZI|nr:NAD(P)-binding protein [Polychaeton citri CBS 116435]
MSLEPFRCDPTLVPPRWWILYKVLHGAWPTHLTVAPTDLTGRWILITGGNNGIGREAALQFARWGANIIIAAREPPGHEIHPTVTVDDCLSAARAAGHTPTVEWWAVDLAQLPTVAALAARYLATNWPLDILVNNAGIPNSPLDRVTEDGYQLIHQVNFLAHALLTLSLLPALARAASPRVVCVTSNMHYRGVFNLAYANSARGAYPNNKLYYQAWLTEFQHRCVDSDRYRHIRICGVHPGFVNSGIWTTTPLGSLPDYRAGEPLWMVWVAKKALDYFSVDSQQGSIAITSAATGTMIKDLGSGGRYFNRVWVETPMPQTVNETCRREVWEFVGGELTALRWEELVVGLQD